MNDGEYPQPLIRTTEFRVPVLAGCKTARLRPVATLFAGTTLAQVETLVNVANVGDTDVTVQFEETDSYLNGPFNDIGPNMAVVHGGQQTTTLFPKHKYLQLKGTTGTGEVHVKLASQLKFDELGFAKNDGGYPSSLWKANYPPWTSL